MSKKDNELERIKRIRDQQLKSRDPQIKQRQLQHKIASRRQKAVRKFSFREMLADVSHKAKGALIGAIIGLVILIGLPLVIEAYWTDLVGIAAILVFAIVGFFFGQALDTRDSLQELIKK